MEYDMTAQQKEGFDEMMMRRALQLALNGAGDVSLNPMVGAVIVAPGGRIIGEGWHRRYGGAHAEVNAVRSVAADDERCCFRRAPSMSRSNHAHITARLPLAVCCSGRKVSGVWP